MGDETISTVTDNIAPEELLTAWHEKCETEAFNLRLVTAWKLWGARNNFIFDIQCTPPQVLLKSAQQIVADQIKLHEAVTRQKRTVKEVGTAVWSPPPTNWVKMTLDASLSEHGMVCLGAVGRDSNEEVVIATAKRITPFWSPLIVEIEAAIFAVQLARRFEYDLVIFESNSLTLIQQMRNPRSFLGECDVILEDLLCLSSSLLGCKWSHVKREGNLAAHNMAKVIPVGEEQIRLGICPRQIA